MSRSEAELFVSPDHRRRTSRQSRHAARAALHDVTLDGDPEALEDADAVCPKVAHDLGRKVSPPPRVEKPGRRPGFKVWKTKYWKRRHRLWQERNEAARRLA